MSKVRPIYLYICLIIIILVGTGLFIINPLSAAAAEFSGADGGTGTAVSPYQISTAQQLAAFAEAVNNGESFSGTYFKLTNKIDLSGICGENVGDDGTSWTPIGNYYEPFSGVFDGNKKEITGLYIDSSSNYQGLFGYVVNGTIKNLGVSGEVKGEKYVGGVVAYNSRSTIDGCYYYGDVSGTDQVGGVAGNNSYSGKVLKCYNRGNVSGKTRVGGVVGSHGGATPTLENCYNTGTVSGESSVGGVVGYSYYMVQNCYNTGDVKGTEYIGGVVGENYSIVSSAGTTQYCYNTGNVEGNSYVGGVVGFHSRDKIQGCYNSGNVSGTEQVGGVVGNNAGTISYCYYLTGKATGGIDGSDVTNQAEGKDEEAFKSGEVAWLLQNGSSAYWGQTLPTNTYPVLKAFDSNVKRVYKVEFIDDEDEPVNTKYFNGTLTELPDVEKADSDAKWYTAKNGEGSQYTIGSAITGDITLYLYWEGEDSEEHTHDDITFTPWTSTSSLPASSGNYYLTDNVSGSWTAPSGETNLCLNGKTISGGITVSSGATLNIYDEGSGNVSIDGYVIRVKSGGKAYIYGGTFEATARYYTVYVESDGFLQIDGGTFKSYPGYATIVVYGEAIINQADVYGPSNAVWAQSGGKVYIYGGNFESTTTTTIAAAANSNMYINMTKGGTITNNISERYAINVIGTAEIDYAVTSGSSTSVYISGTATINGGSFTSTNSNAVVINSGGTANISGGSFSGQYAVSDSGTFNLSGSPTFTGSTADIYLSSDKKITVTGTMSNSTPYSVSTEDTPEESSPVVITDSNDTSYNNSDKFTSANGSYIVRKNSSNQLELAVPIETCSVTFDYQYDNKTETKEYKVWETYGELPVPTRTGYIFKGWFTNANGEGEPIQPDDSVANEDHTIYACWEKCEHENAEWTDNKDGKTHSRKCDDCGMSETEGHNYGKWTSDNDETHSRKCDDCGMTEAEDHNYGEWTSDNDETHSRECSDCKVTKTEDHTGGTASCTEMAKCTICDQEYGDLLPHTPDSGPVTKKPTTSEPGERTFKCLICGEVIRTEEIPVISEDHTHSYGDDWKYDADNHWHECVECGEETDVSHHDIVIDEAVLPSCTTPGKTEGKYCSVCGLVFAEQSEIPETGHTIVNDEAVLPSCTTPGKTEGSHCAVCGEVITEQTEIPALGHTGGTASCTEKAKCTVCGQEYGDLLPHTPDSGTVTKEPTATETGIRTFKCTVCGTVIRTETIPAIGTNTPPTGGRPSTGGGISGTPGNSDNQAANTDTSAPAKDSDTLLDAVIDAEDGDTVKAAFSTDDVSVSKEVFEAAAEKNIILDIKLKDMYWTIDGKDIEKSRDVNLGASRKNKVIPKSEIKATAGNAPYVPLSLEHNGDFGFKGILNISIKSYDSKYANLYYYINGRLELLGHTKISGGYMRFAFKHASDYLIVIGDEPYGEDISSDIGVYDFEDISSAAGLYEANELLDELITKDDLMKQTAYYDNETVDLAKKIAEIQSSLIWFTHRDNVNVTRRIFIVFLSTSIVFWFIYRISKVIYIFLVSISSNPCPSIYSIKSLRL